MTVFGLFAPKLSLRRTKEIIRLAHYKEIQGLFYVVTF